MNRPTLAPWTVAVSSVAALVATVAPARAQVYAPTVGFEHEVNKKLYVMVTDHVERDPETQVASATLAPDAKARAFLCHGDNFCLTVDNGSDLEIVTTVWNRTDLVAKVAEMNKGLKALHDYMSSKDCEVVSRTWPAWSARSNQWHGKFPNFPSRDGCQVSLLKLLKALPKLDPGYKATAHPQKLKQVYLFKATYDASFNATEAANTQINLTIPVNAFAKGPPVFALFSEHATPRTDVVPAYALASDLYVSATEAIKDRTGFSQLANYALGVTASLRLMGVTSDQVNFGGTKNSYDLYLKTYLSDVFAMMKDNAVEAKDTEFEKILTGFSLACNAQCVRTLRAWATEQNKFLPATGATDGGSAATKELLDAVRTEVAWDVKAITDGERAPRIATPAGPWSYADVGVVVLVEMRDNTFRTNKAFSLAVTKEGVLAGDVTRKPEDLPFHVYK